MSKTKVSAYDLSTLDEAQIGGLRTALEGIGLTATGNPDDVHRQRWNGMASYGGAYGNRTRKPLSANSYFIGDGQLVLVDAHLARMRTTLRTLGLTGTVHE